MRVLRQYTYDQHRQHLKHYIGAFDNLFMPLLEHLQMKNKATVARYLSDPSPRRLMNDMVCQYTAKGMSEAVTRPMVVESFRKYFSDGWIWTQWNRDVAGYVLDDEPDLKLPPFPYAFIEELSDCISLEGTDDQPAIMLDDDKLKQRFTVELNERQTHFAEALQRLCDELNGLDKKYIHLPSYVYYNGGKWNVDRQKILSSL